MPDLKGWYSTELKKLKKKSLIPPKNHTRPFSPQSPPFFSAQGWFSHFDSYMAALRKQRQSKSADEASAAAWRYGFSFRGVAPTFCRAATSLGTLLAHQMEVFKSGNSVKNQVEVQYPLWPYTGQISSMATFTQSLQKNIPNWGWDWHTWGPHRPGDHAALCG